MPIKKKSMGISFIPINKFTTSNLSLGHLKFYVLICLFSITHLVTKSLPKIKLKFNYCKFVSPFTAFYSLVNYDV